MGGSLGELAAFMEKQQRLQLEREDKVEAKLESQRLEAKAERVKRMESSSSSPRHRRDSLSPSPLSDPR